jgi:hypothetical protein
MTRRGTGVSSSFSRGGDGGVEGHGRGEEQIQLQLDFPDAEHVAAVHARLITNLRAVEVRAVL